MVALDIHVLLCNRDQINLEICRNLFIEFILKLNFSFLYCRVFPHWNHMAGHLWDYTLCVQSILHLHRPMTKLCLSCIFSISLAEFFNSNNLHLEKLLCKKCLHRSKIKKPELAMNPKAVCLPPPLPHLEDLPRPVTLPFPCPLLQMGVMAG